MKYEDLPEFVQMLIFFGGLVLAAICIFGFLDWFTRSDVGLWLWELINVVYEMKQVL